MPPRNADFSDMIGAKFKDGGRDLHYGIDCWGVIMECGRRTGQPFPDFDLSSNEKAGIDSLFQENALKFWSAIDVPEYGCIVVMRGDHTEFCTHFGFYIGDGRFVHAVEGRDVRTNRLDHPLWRRRIVGYYRWAGHSK